jgi:hypothetical protein
MGSPRLPPYGWGASVGRHQTVVRGWDWATGAMTFQLGIVVVGVLGLLGFLPLIVLGAGVGWRLVIDERGFGFSRTWFCVPVSWRQFPVGTTVEVQDDPWAVEDFSAWVMLGPEDDARSVCFGAGSTAEPVFDAIQKAIELHHARTPASGSPYR